MAKATPKSSLPDPTAPAPTAPTPTTSSPQNPSTPDQVASVGNTIPDPRADVTIDAEDRTAPAADEHPEADAEKIPSEGRERGVEGMDDDEDGVEGPDESDSGPDADGEDLTPAPHAPIRDVVLPDEDGNPTVRLPHYNGPASESRRLSADPPQAFTGDI